MAATAVATTAENDADDDVAALQELLGPALTIWSQHATSGWALTTGSTLAPFSEPEESPLAGDVQSLPVAPVFSSDAPPARVTALLEETSRRREPGAAELSPGQHLLAVPLGDSTSAAERIAVAHLAPDSPGLLAQLANATQCCLRQRKELARLREENDYFLKQVSEDFEELTFIRSVAERLALVNDPGDLTNLTQYTLPLLGEAASVEALYYFADRSRDRPRLVHRWQAAGCTRERMKSVQLESLVEQFRGEAADTPAVRNGVDQTDLGRSFPGLRGFVLVSVSSALGPLGWLLAVNRRERYQNGRHDSLKSSVPNELGTNEASLIGTAAAMMASHAHNIAFVEEKECLLVNIVRSLVSAVDSRDPYTCGHSERVALFAKRLAEELGFDENQRQRIYLTGLLHDVGKIGVSDATLNKPGKLTDEEFAEIKRHPELGWAILHELTQLDYVLPGVLHHHERIDGAGYPDGLADQEIPLEGRLLAVVDAYDAMTTDRPYRPGMVQEKAQAILAEGAGQQWDAQIVAAFLRIMPDIVAIRNNYRRPAMAVRKPTRPTSAADRGQDRRAELPAAFLETAKAAPQ